jgi:hypothetical protein
MTTAALLAHCSHIKLSSCPAKNWLNDKKVGCVTTAFAATNPITLLSSNTHNMVIP